MSYLRKLMVDTRSAWVDYPGLNGFEVELANLSRPELTALRKRCLYTKMNRKTRMPEEHLDEDKFISEFAKATIKNWKGLTLAKLEQLMLVDIAGQDPETEVPYSHEDATLLLQNSGDFDAWVNDTVFDLEHFRTAGEGGSVGATGEVAERSRDADD